MEGTVVPVKWGSKEARWAKHYCNPWEKRAKDSRVPKWMRVASVGFARVNTAGACPCCEKGVGGAPREPGGPGRQHQ